MSDKEPQIIFDKIGIDAAALCSYNICPNEHKWRVQLAITKCKGCDSEIIARRLVNCPVCNEPCIRTEIRLDHVASGMSVMPLCKGGERNTQSDSIILTWHEQTFETPIPKEIINGDDM